MSFILEFFWKHRCHGKRSLFREDQRPRKNSVFKLEVEGSSSSHLYFDIQTKKHQQKHDTVNHLESLPHSWSNTCLPQTVVIFRQFCSNFITPEKPQASIQLIIKIDGRRDSRRKLIPVWALLELRYVCWEGKIVCVVLSGTYPWTSKYAYFWYTMW